jgi:transcription antitermination factor NusG
VPNITWQVVNTAPRFESFVRDNLARLGFDARLFLIRERRPDRHWRVGPLFPRYLFVPFDIEAPGWGDILRMQGVVSMLRSGLGPASVPEAAIQRWESLAAAQPDGVICQELPHGPLLQKGAKVDLIEGPFEGYTGIVKRSSAERVWLLLNILGADRQVAVGRTQVKAA